MILDEVYQAALAAGSGGIRWNSTVNYIQIMDENKNWINYKKFNPNKSFIRVYSGVASNTNVSCAYDGLYLLFISAYNGNNNPLNITGNIIEQWIYTTGYNGYCAIIECVTGDRIQVSGFNGYAGSSVYYLSGYNRVIGNITGFHVENTSSTYTYNEGAGNMVTGLAFGQTYGRVTINCDTINKDVYVQSGYFSCFLLDRGDYSCNVYG